MAAVAEGFVERFPFSQSISLMEFKTFVPGDGETWMHSEQCFGTWRRWFPFSDAFEMKV